MLLRGRAHADELDRKTAAAQKPYRRHNMAGGGTKAMPLAVWPALHRRKKAAEQTVPRQSAFL